MDAEATLALIRARVASLPQVASISVHIFGSILDHRKYTDDLDVLVICHEFQMQNVQEILEHLPLPWPIDLTLMTPDEEEAYRFLECVKSVQVYPERKTT